MAWRSACLVRHGRAGVTVTRPRPRAADLNGPRSARGPGTMPAKICADRAMVERRLHALVGRPDEARGWLFDIRGAEARFGTAAGRGARWRPDQESPGKRVSVVLQVA